MAKAYSNKALPSGTILREWRLEEVLGVGGFGIVYKGRGIYFDELVAIKEYFPSAISERDAESTVVPIDSDAEEVHALGLKKFVEEAKLLWNLSTPSRHPNIVSVRSLFEIHGTAYMVMDFEDGVSLTDLLKKGEKFDEAKLRKMVLPVASGLERAHRVGVLHRDIKPSNILVTDNGDPVLIDFGSARFETEGVTSTTVTFHTPPYAAIEQYVKTYDQGPWTDIYALGVVLYRCITGEKPAEVLERMHGGQEPPLVDGDWPGFSRKFLAAVDAAMIIKPSDRPQSLSQWLAMFEDDSTDSGAFGAAGDDEDEEATRIGPISASIDEIKPVEPEKKVEPPAKPEPQPEIKPEDVGAGAVPDDVDQVKFKMPGDDDTSAKRTRAKAGDIAKDAKRASKEPSAADAPAQSKDDKRGADAPPATKAAGAPGQKKDAAKPERKPLSRGVLLGGAGAIAVVAGLAWAFMGGSPEPAPVAVVEEISPDDGFGPALLKLAELARANGIDGKSVADLEGQADEISNQESENVALSDQPSRESDVSFNRLRIAETTRESLGKLADGMSQVLAAETQRLSAAAPWADPRRANSAAKETPALQKMAGTIETAFQTASKSVDDLKSAKTAEDSVPLAQKMIMAVAAYKTAARDALKANPRKPGATASATTAAEATEADVPAAQVVEPVSSGRSLDQIRADIDGVASEVDRMADDVIKMGRARDPGRNATDDQKKAYQTLQGNAKAASDYKSYIDRLQRSSRGGVSVAEAEQLLVQARQTRQYVNSMILSSRVSVERLGS